MSEELLTGDIPDEEEESEFIGGFDNDGEGIFGDVPEVAETTDPFGSIEANQESVAPLQSFTPTVFTQSIAPKPPVVVQAPRITAHVTEINIQNCQLCRQVFLNRQLLLDHMRQFHNIDTGHVLAGSSTRQPAAAPTINNVSAGPTRVQQSQLAAIGKPNIIRVRHAGTQGGMIFQARPQAATGVTTFRLQPASPARQSLRPLESLDKPHSGGIPQIVASQLLGLKQTPRMLTSPPRPAANQINTTTLTAPNTLQNLRIAHSQTVKPPNRYIPIAPKGSVVSLKELNLRNRNTASSSVLEGPKSTFILASESGVGYNCKQCWRHFTTTQEAESHVTEVHLANQKCKICGETFLDLDFLQAHVEVVHKGKLPSVFQDDATGGQLEASAKPVSPEIITLSDDETEQSAYSVPKPRESVSMAAATAISEARTTEVDEYTYLKYVSVTGTLTPAQLEFAGQMIETLGTFARCKICNKKYTSTFHAKSHIRHTHLREYHKCAVCHQKFKSKLKRDQHRVHAHPDVPTGNFSTKDPASTSRPNSNQSASGAGGTFSRAEIVSLTKGVRNAPIFVDAAIKSMIIYSTTTPGSYSCGRCQKEFKAHKYCHQHVRAVHFSRTNLCSRCLCYYDSVLLHRLCCTGDNTGATEFVPSVDSLISVMEDLVMPVTHHNGKEVYPCRLCNKRYDKKYFTESHIWVDHCRSVWTALVGVETTETVYEQFIQHQKNVNPDQHVMQQFSSAKATLPGSENHTPAAESDALSAITPEVSWLEEDFDPSIQCEVEFADEEESTTTPGGAVNPNTTVTNTPSRPPGTLRNQLGKELTPIELLNWSRKALKYIHEKNGKFVCIICQEVSKLRTSLVDHVRETHLLKRQPTGSGEIQQPIASGNGQDRRTCTFCSEEFQTVIERENHETFCATTRQYADAQYGDPSPYHTPMISQPPAVQVQSRGTSSLDRAMKFTKQEGREYMCTVCSVRATKMYRLLAHIISIHFGEDTFENEKNKCGGCGKHFAKAGARAMHAKTCKAVKLKKMEQSLKQVAVVNHAPQVGKAAEPTKATAVVEPQRSRYGRNYNTRKEDSNATIKPGPERSKLVPDTWNCDRTGLLPYKLGEIKLLRCSACEVLIPEAQNGGDHLRKFHGGSQLYNCTKCEAVFLTGIVRDEHQIGCQQETPDEELEPPPSPNIGCYEDDGGVEDYSASPDTPSPEVYLPKKSPVKVLTPKKKPGPLSSKKIKAVVKNIVKKYTVSSLNRQAKLVAASKLQKPVVKTEKSSVMFTGNRAPRSTRYRMLSSKNDADVVKLMKPVKKIKGTVKYRCMKCPLRKPNKRVPTEVHVRVVHFKEKPIECLLCQQTFSSWSTINKHFLRTHPNGVVNNEPEEDSDEISAPEPKKVCVEKFQCKLCKETCNDIPMVRFHLVSEHSGELQAMGKADQLFNEVEKVAESLSVPIREELNPGVRSSEATAAGSKRKTKPGPARSKPKTSKPSTASSAEHEIDWRNTEPPKVFMDESLLLESIKNTAVSTPPCTVRMELLRIKHPMPEFMMEAAKRVIEKVMPQLFVCQLCNKQFQTASGSMKHARRVHFGEYVQCGHCPRTFYEEAHLKAHESSCSKKKNPQSPVKAKPRPPAPVLQNYPDLPGGIDPDLLLSIMPLAPISRPGPASSKKKIKKKKKKVAHQAAIKFNFAKKSTD